jgi:hypothetical protein
VALVRRPVKKLDYGTLNNTHVAGCNPKGVAALSPGLPYSATLGGRIAMGPNPNGVAALRPRMMNNEM